jgi:hypothetical protein
MQNSDLLLAGLTFSGENMFLWVAVGVALVFLGLLAFDLSRRRRRENRRRGRERQGLRDKLLEPVHRARGFRTEVVELLRERARRKRRQSDRPPENPL